MSTLLYRTTELRDPSVRSCWFSLTSGWYDGIQARGTDPSIAQAAGRDALPRLADLRIITLEGVVFGTNEADWNAVMTTLETTFDPAALPADLVVYTPYLGLAAGTRTISARVESVRTVDRIHGLVTEYQVVLNALSNPPNWT